MGWFSTSKKFDIDEESFKVWKEKIFQIINEFETVKVKLSTMQTKLEDLEIKALESRKIYHKKLKSIMKEEEAEGENDIKGNVFLDPHGKPI